LEPFGECWPPDVRVPLTARSEPDHLVPDPIDRLEAHRPRQALLQLCLEPRPLARRDVELIRQAVPMTVQRPGDDVLPLLTADIRRSLAGQRLQVNSHALAEFAVAP